MFDHGLEYLKKKLPEFENKPTPQATQTPSNTGQTAPPLKPPQPPPQHLSPNVEKLDSLVAFLRRYLICDDYQLHLLALWIVHTYCFQDFLTTAYLDIRSPESQCGKTRCLEILTSLCESSWLVTGATASTLKRRLLHQRSVNELRADSSYPPPFAILLDNCHYLLGSSERQP